MAFAYQMTKTTFVLYKANECLQLKVAARLTTNYYEKETKRSILSLSHICIRV